MAEFLLNFFAAFVIISCQHLEKESVHFIKLGQVVKVQEPESRVIPVVFQQLGFQQFKEQDPVYPGYAKLQPYAEKLFFFFITVVVKVGYFVQAVFCFKYGDGIFQQ
ncbi:MAG TPA: hypothetical protein VG961_06410 [Ignavibacteria bacterium]|nr:hypothetical protein [Ignavibacteria bacterium]